MPDTPVSLVGTSQLTLFSPVFPDELTATLQPVLGTALTSEGDRIELRLSTGAVTIGARAQEPGNDVARMILGLVNALRRATSETEDGVTTAQAAVGRTRVVLGIGFTPPVVGDDQRLDLVLQCASALDAMAFDGQVALTSTLRPIAQLPAR